MGHRELSVSICGVVVGVILGAGAVSFAQDASLSASASNQVVSFRTLPAGTQLIKRRDVDATVQPEDGRARLFPTVKEPATESVPATVEAPKDESTCGVVKAVLKDIGATHDRVIAATQRNTELRQILKAKLKSLEEKHCPAEATSEQAPAASHSGPSAEMPPTVDNDCERYAFKSKRQIECQIWERLGKDYSGF